MILFSKPRRTAAGKAAESPLVVTLPLVVLALLSIFGGLLNLPGSHWLETWLEHSLDGGEAGEFILTVALGSLGVALLGLLLAWLTYGRKPLEKAAQSDPLAKPLGGLFTALNRKWWVDELYQAVIIKPYYWLADFFAQPVDQGLIDGIANGLGSLVRTTAGAWRRVQSGYVRSYAVTILIGVMLILIWLVLR